MSALLEAKNPGSLVSVGGADTPIVAANPGRQEITVTNDHATQIVYLRLNGSGAALNSGIRLNAAGGTWTSTNWKGAISGFASGAATGVLVVEM